jgi:hypothetical protein
MVASTGQSLQSEWLPGCTSVLAEVLAERVRQVARYGSNDNLEVGMGPQVRWLGPYTHDSAEDIEQVLRNDYEDFEEETGLPTWAHLIREELAETFMEADVVKREEEAIQVAALLVSYVESSRRLRGAQA